MRIDKDHYRGCLLGGGTADAKAYRRTHAGGKNQIMDNTQLSIFTVDGMVWADDRAKRKGIYAYIPCLFYSYQKWYYTQTGGLADKDYGFILDGEVMQHDELFARRGEGVTSLNALASSIKNSYGTIESRINNLNRPGCVARVAPIGMYFAHNPDMAFRIGCESAAITHGHTESIMSSGYMAVLIAYLAAGASLEEAVEQSLAQLDESSFDSDTTADVIRNAVSLASSDKPTRKALENIGEGWTAPEATALATFIALRHKDDFEGAVEAAIDFDGNADSVAPITGNISGMLAGSLEIPPKQILDLELADLIIHGADLILEAQKGFARQPA